MSALLLLATPLLGCAACLALPRRHLAAAVAGGSIAVELLLTMIAEADSEILGVTLRVDGLTRLLLVMFTLATAAAIGTAVSDGKLRLVPVPLLILAPAAGALLTRANPPVAILMLELSLLAAVPALVAERQVEAPSVQRYITAVVVGGTVLLLALGMADRYRTGHDSYLLKLILALVAVGWGLLVAGFPFQFWLPSICRGISVLGAMIVLAVVRPLGLGVFLGMLAALPWLLSDPRSPLALSAAGAAAALAGAALSLLERRPLARLAYLATADVGYILVGLAAGSALGLAGAMLGTINHTLAMLLVTASLALRHRNTAGDRGNVARRIGTAGLGLGMLALLAAPPGSGFLGRWMIYQVAWATSPIVVVVLLIASATALLSVLRFGQEPPVSMIAGGSTDSYDDQGSGARVLMLSVACGGALVLAIGIYPAPLVNAVIAAAAEFGGMPAW